MSTPRIALIAHDAKKDDIVALAGAYRATLAQCRLVATGTTGGRIAQAHGLDVGRKLSGPLGGDLQIGAELADGRVDIVIFLRGPMTGQAPDPGYSSAV
ncbi:methylglyoxal synthase, partial [Burkholderia pseudomallei]